MTVTVTEVDGWHRADVPFEGDNLPCCTPGHPEALEAAAHAWRLTRAIARKTAQAAAKRS